MSSLARRIQKNILKRKGFYRNRAGYVCASDGTVVGKHWPTLIINDVKEEGVA